MNKGIIEGYLVSGDKSECSGCEACVQVCNCNAIEMRTDDEGFRYPHIDSGRCIDCNRCREVCPSANQPYFNSGDRYAFGGYSNDWNIRFNSTSGGAFSEIVNAFCDENYVIFGAKSSGLRTYHSYIKDKKDIEVFRKSKYSQSIIGNTYREARKFLIEGRKVLYSGTPCQIAGLVKFMEGTDTTNLLTVEVICEGVPSPLYIDKMDAFCKKRYGSGIQKIDYRYKGLSIFGNGKWDFQIMKIILKNNKTVVKDRWLNPFWSVWLDYLISRPSCYQCLYTVEDRVADISLGDLWEVFVDLPELYGKNGGTSLMIGNNAKGIKYVRKAQENMSGHDIDYARVVKSSSRLRKHIDMNMRRDECMNDLKSEMRYKDFNKKWAKRPGIKLLISKYIWGNRQRLFFWNLRRKSN